MADESELDHLRRLLTPTQPKKRSRLKKILDKFGKREPKYGRKSKKKDDKAA
jgi:hypothetical protein